MNAAKNALIRMADSEKEAYQNLSNRAAVKENEASELRSRAANARALEIHFRTAAEALSD